MKLVSDIKMMIDLDNIKRLVPNYIPHVNVLEMVGNIADHRCGCLGFGSLTASIPFGEVA